jgi:hypothetical protein
MERLKSWEIITEIGKKMHKGWLDIANQNNISISVFGMPAMGSYSFNSISSLKYKTYLTQEMLKVGILASTNFYPCICHTDSHLEMYINYLNDIFKVIDKCEKGLIRIDDLLEGPVCHASFERLN